MGEAKEAFSTCQPKGEITLLIEGKANCIEETPSECQLENELRQLITRGHSLSSVMISFTIGLLLLLNSSFMYLLKLCLDSHIVEPLRRLSQIWKYDVYSRQSNW